MYIIDIVQIYIKPLYLNVTIELTGSEHQQSDSINRPLISVLTGSIHPAFSLFICCLEARHQALCYLSH